RGSSSARAAGEDRLLGSVEGQDVPTLVVESHQPDFHPGILQQVAVEEGDAVGVHLDGAGAGGRGAEIGRGVAEAAGKDGEYAGLAAVDIGAAGPVALDRCLLRKSRSRGQQGEGGDGGGGWTHLGTQLLLRSNFPNPGSLVNAIKAR